MWLDLARDHHQEPLLEALAYLVQRRDIELILPRTVVDEFARNKAKVIEDSSRSLSSTFKRVKKVVEQLGPQKRGTQSLIRQLNNLDYQLPALGQRAVAGIGRIERLFAQMPIIEVSDAVKLRAAERAIDGRAPFHRQKNSVNDAILIETYADAISGASTKGTRYAFVTHNVRDFSATNANNNLPHPDMASLCSKKKSLYFTTLGETLRRAAPGVLSEITIEHEWEEEPRQLDQILDAMDLLFHQVWYNRHMNTRYRIATGKTKIVEKETLPVKDHRKRPIQRDVWERALKAAARVEKKYGLENLGPWSDFEWGMVNGKLSALRWVLGDEWDMLDT